MKLTYHVAQRQGARPYQEDAWCVATPGGWNFFAVLDGHGGSATARYAAEVLPRKIVGEITQHSPAQTLWKSFTETSAEAERQTDDGATALAVLIGQGQLHWAHCGDCRLLLVSANGSQQLTTEHRLDDAAERTRIEHLGKAVVRPPYLFVGPYGLMPTRSLGDRWFKPAGVIATPEVGSRLLEVGDHWLILGTDGVWDVLANDAVAEITRWHKTAKAISEAIADAALANGGTDNITVLVAELKPKLRRRSGANERMVRSRLRPIR